MLNRDSSALTVRRVCPSHEKTVQYDSSTRWVSQEHGSKKVNDIDASQVKDDDRVICKGTWEKGATLHATLISKRLSHSRTQDESRFVSEVGTPGSEGGRWNCCVA